MVMPLFFVTGGTTGLQSWRRLGARGGSGFGFAQARLLRLVRPAAALLTVMFLGLWAALLLGVDPQVTQLIATGAGMPLWFLAAYLAAQLNIPLLARFHERAPWLTLASLVALVVSLDCLRGSLPHLAYLNLVFVWRAVQQLGFLMADGHLARLPRSGQVGLIMGANLLLGVVTGLGLYSGNMLVNLNPPNLCLVLLGVSHAAVFQLLHPRIGWLCGVRWVRAVVSVAGRLEDRPTAAVHARVRPASAVVTAAVVVFMPVADAALNGLTLPLLGGGAACFTLAVLLLGRVPERVPGQRRRDRRSRVDGALPAGPSSATVEP